MTLLRICPAVRTFTINEGNQQSMKETLLTLISAVLSSAVIAAEVPTSVVAVTPEDLVWNTTGLAVPEIQVKGAGPSGRAFIADHG